MRTLAAFIIVMVTMVVPSLAQTIPGTIGFDLNPGTPSFSDITGLAINDSDSDIDTARTVPAAGRFSTLVRLQGVTGLMGVSFDFNFNPSVLTLVEIRETRADLNFDSRLSIQELNAVIQLAAQAKPVDQLEFTYNDGTGVITTKPGILIDPNNNGQLDLSDLNAIILEAALDINDVPFWTEVQRRRQGQGFQRFESAKVFDDRDDIRTTGIAEDNTVVLLARPGDGRDGSGNIVSGYGFSGDAILFEVIFQPKAGQSGNSTQITIENAVAIDESFKSLSDVKNIANVLTSTVTVQ